MKPCKLKCNRTAEKRVVWLERQSFVDHWLLCAFCTKEAGQLAEVLGEAEGFIAKDLAVGEEVAK